MKRSITVLLMLLVGTLCFAQNNAKQTPSKTITGTVTDARTGETLIGATIYDTISHKGTVTNQHGRFSLTLPGQRAVLRISFVGYQLQFHPVSLNQNTRLNVQLEGSTTLAEVRIIGQRTPHVESSQASVIEIPVEQVQAIPMLKPCSFSLVSRTAVKERLECTSVVAALTRTSSSSTASPCTM